MLEPLGLVQAMHFLAAVECFHGLSVVFYSRIIFSCFYLKLYNLQKDEKMESLNYGKKIA
jgi:hypothetical protein